MIRGDIVRLSKNYVDILRPTPVARIAMEAMTGTVTEASDVFVVVKWHGRIHTMMHDEVELVVL
jgi:hypothetical protein